jgi:hypothetical protein
MFFWRKDNQSTLLTHYRREKEIRNSVKQRNEAGIGDCLHD